MIEGFIDEKRAIELLLANASGCGLNRLSRVELINLCRRIQSARDAAERAAYNRGYLRALADNKEHQGVIIQSHN